VKPMRKKKGKSTEPQVKPYKLDFNEVIEEGRRQGGMIRLSEIYLPDKLVQVASYYYHNLAAREAAIKEGIWEHIKRKMIRSFIIFKREIPWWLKDEEMEKEEREYLRGLGFDV
jgi:hypothetical protein